MTTITQTRPSFSPLNLESRSPAMRLAAVALGTLVLAISSVQLFVQRCLLNLEIDVSPSSIETSSCAPTLRAA